MLRSRRSGPGAPGDGRRAAPRGPGSGSGSGSSGGSGAELLCCRAGAPAPAVPGLKRAGLGTAGRCQLKGVLGTGLGACSQQGKVQVN